MKTVEKNTLKLCQAVGEDFNMVEVEVRDGIPYAIDFCNTAPDEDVNSVGQENFDWVVKTAADFAIEKAKANKPGVDNLTWGTYIKASAAGISFKGNAKPAAAKTETAEPAKKAAPKKNGKKEMAV